MIMAKRYDDSRQWYAIHTYSGYEEKVAESIRQRINAVDMADKIFDCIVPKEKQIQIKNGKRKVVDAKIFQGYVLVEMKLTDETWYIVRNTPGVTGFVGADTTPTPVSEQEIRKIKKRMGVEEPKHQIDFSVVDVVSIVDGETLHQKDEWILRLVVVQPYFFDKPVKPEPHGRVGDLIQLRHLLQRS